MIKAAKIIITTFMAAAILLVCPSLFIDSPIFGTDAALAAYTHTVNAHVTKAGGGNAVGVTVTLYEYVAPDSALKGTGTTDAYGNISFQFTAPGSGTEIYFFVECYKDMYPDLLYGGGYHISSATAGTVFELSDFTYDSDAPTSSVETLPAINPSTTIAVRWAGTDPSLPSALYWDRPGSGLKSYDIQYKDPSLGDWTDWITGTTETQATFTGLKGHTYYFRSRARDNYNNLEAWPGGNGDAQTTVGSSVTGSISGLASPNGTKIYLTGPVNSTVTADASGGFTFPDLPQGTYNITTESINRYTVTPASRSAIISNSDITGMNFTYSPILLISTPAALSFTAQVGGANPANKTIAISNSGGAGIQWTVSDNASWVTFSPTNGINSGNVDISVNTAGLAAGTYNASVTISSPGAANSPLVIPVAFTISAAPVLTYSISGTVSGYTGSVSIFLGGDSNQVIVADSPGSYTFSNLLPGNYTVAAQSITDHSLSPASFTAIAISDPSSISHAGPDFIYTNITLPISSVPVLSGQTRNHPNPFNPKIESTRIIFNVASASVKVLVYDLKGRAIWTTSASSGNGYYEVVWDGKSFTGEYVANGSYICLIVSDGTVLAKGQMMVWK